MTSTLISTTLKAWHFLYRRAFIEGFGHISARIDDETAADAGAELLANRGPFRRVWALVESDVERVKGEG